MEEEERANGWLLNYLDRTKCNKWLRIEPLMRYWPITTIHVYWYVALGLADTLQPAISPFPAFPLREERAFIKVLFVLQTTNREAAVRLIFSRRVNFLFLSRRFSIFIDLRFGEIHRAQLPFRKIMDIVKQPVATRGVSHERSAVSALAEYRLLFSFPRFLAKSSRY